MSHEHTKHPHQRATISRPPNSFLVWMINDLNVNLKGKFEATQKKAKAENNKNRVNRGDCITPAISSVPMPSVIYSVTVNYVFE